MGKDVIVACDFSSAEQTISFLDRFTGRKPFHPELTRGRHKYFIANKNQNLSIK